MIYNYRANSEIIFSSKKSEGNGEFDENILIDLFKEVLIMGKLNVFISHRWDYPDNYERISCALDRSKYDVSDRSVESSDPLVGTMKQITAAIKGKIDSASVILVPARPAVVTVGSMGRKEVDYALNKKNSSCRYWNNK